MTESQQNIDRLQYQRGVSWTGYLSSGTWRGYLRTGNEYDEIAYWSDNKDVLPKVIHQTGHRVGWVPGPKPEVRPATLGETLLLVEAIPLALKQLRDKKALLNGAANLRQAKTLTKRLIEDTEKKPKSEDQTRRLSQVRESLAAEGLIHKKEQA